ncbi:MAG: hypothetical protein F6K63_30965 [Moorea sp. SIO1G6]|uniref:hypothetical protein n=1 Tax=Moorena sp. SIO1G6 TaxID=2607840 RepID=UPI0013BFCC95|nr:hypothetical protein [Moorena sp. SIO1G6]NET68578.1 hypothetical protein [Moorena sp. SIO1G6]
MRIYLYILAGITSALIGWNIGQVAINNLGLSRLIPEEIVLFPCIAISLAVGMVINEIFISNPTRLKLNLRIAKIPILIAAGLGIIIGLISGVIYQILLLSPIPGIMIRLLSWLLIGSSVGLAEGLTWWWRSVEAGDPKRFQQRLITSVFAASGAALVAALLFESMRPLLSQIENRGFEDPLGFSILGLVLGLVFSITNSPSYMAALRAGGGFEYRGDNYEDIEPGVINVNNPFPKIDNPLLKFVSKSKAYEIEEGLSIQLPATGTIRIGSAVKQTNHKGGSDIYLPGLPLHVADIVVMQRQAILSPNPQHFHTIEINGKPLKNRDDIILKHNHVLTFNSLYPGGKNEEKIYRFVYYNRFFDPQA